METDVLLPFWGCILKKQRNQGSDREYAREENHTEVVRRCRKEEGSFLNFGADSHYWILCWIKHAISKRMRTFLRTFQESHKLLLVGSKFLAGESHVAFHGDNQGLQPLPSHMIGPMPEYCPKWRYSLSL